MRLHYAEVLNPRKVCALVKHLDAPVEFCRVDLGKGAHMTRDFRRLNPNAKVPVLEDGATVLWEADAILCHLAIVMNSDLWPRDARQVEVVRWLSWNQVHFQPLGGAFYFERVIKKMFDLGPPDEDKLAATLQPFRRVARVLDTHLADRRYMLGDALSVADFSVFGALPYREAAGLPLDDFPAIRRWIDRLEAMPAVRDPFPPATVQTT